MSPEGQGLARRALSWPGIRLAAPAQYIFTLPRRGAFASRVSLCLHSCHPCLLFTPVLDPCSQIAWPFKPLGPSEVNPALPRVGEARVGPLLSCR